MITRKMVKDCNRVIKKQHKVVSRLHELCSEIPREYPVLRNEMGKREEDMHNIIFWLEQANTMLDAEHSRSLSSGSTKEIS